MRMACLIEENYPDSILSQQGASRSPVDHRTISLHKFPQNETDFLSLIRWMLGSLEYEASNYLCRYNVAISSAVALHRHLRVQ